MNKVLVEKRLPAGQIIQIVQGDITTRRGGCHRQRGERTSAARWRRGLGDLQKGRTGHPEGIGSMDPGTRTVSHSHPAWTSGGHLPAKYVIHAVGPVWGDGDEDKKLTEAVTGSLRVADELKCSSMAMPAISTGIFGFPKDRAAEIIFSAIEEYLERQFIQPDKWSSWYFSTSQPWMYFSNPFRRNGRIKSDHISTKFEDQTGPCPSGTCQRNAGKRTPLWWKVCGWWKKRSTATGDFNLHFMMKH